MLPYEPNVLCRDLFYFLFSLVHLLLQKTQSIESSEPTWGAEIWKTINVVYSKWPHRLTPVFPFGSNLCFLNHSFIWLDI